MEKLLNSKRFCWRESTLSLCVIYICTHVYVHMCIYTLLGVYTHTHCACVYEDEIYVVVCSVK